MITKLEPVTPTGSPVGAHHAPWCTGRTWRRVLLGCGILSSAWYIASDILATVRYEGYKYTEQQISELMASGAPTRPLLVALFTPYNLLVAAFGVGIWTVARPERTARLIGILFIAYASIGQVALLLFPMNTREALAAGEQGLANTMHPIVTAVLSLLLVLTMGFGATLLDRRFRFYTYGTILTLVAFGALLSVQVDNMVANESTPWMGIEERVNIYATMLWIAVLATGLLRAESITARCQRKTPTVNPGYAPSAPAGRR